MIMKDLSRYTEYHANIDAAVEAGRTLVFDNPNTAKERADELGSYVYAVYQYTDEGRLLTNGEYAVPK